LDLQKIENLIRPLIEQSGCTLYDIEFQGRVLRVSIEKPGGVSIEDCAETSRTINPVLDVEDVVPGGHYELEVSSPGLNRSLKKPEHFNGAVGEKINVSTSEPMAKWNDASDEWYGTRKRVTGTLTEFDGNWLKVNADGRDVKIPLSGVTRANVDFELKTTPKKGKKG
jgi:ribosome maturation factor RimP